jgi:hypothetical protein
VSDTSFDIRHDDTGTELVVSVGTTDIAHYVYRPDDPIEESPKPYLYPITTLSGAPLGVYRPWDHRWHKGLQMTWSHVSGDNFWGGPTFERGAPGHGYVWHKNQGRQQHRAFESGDLRGSDVSLRQRLDWIASSGAGWFDESRTLRFHGADTERGIWALDFTTSLLSVHDEPLLLGSPSTHGRPNAGYTGLFWRGPRAWTGGEIIAAGGQGGESVMGGEAAWAAITSEHDEIDGGATVLAFSGTSSAQGPIKWFARSAAFACLNPSPAFDTEITLEPGEALSLCHRFVFVDRQLDRAGLQRLADEFAL